MVVQLLADLTRSASPARLARYGDPETHPTDTIITYLWNIALAEALYPCLSVVEISLRNSIHSSLTDAFDRADWFDRPGLLELNQARAVENARRQIQRERDAATPDRIVSRLTFGFWVTILSRPYDARLWQPGESAPLRQAFPRVTRRQRQRAIIHRRFNEIRALRNRVVHHEPLWDDPTLLATHGRTLEALRWLNPAMIGLMSAQDRFPTTFTSGRTVIAANVAALIAVRSGIPPSSHGDAH